MRFVFYHIFVVTIFMFFADGTHIVMKAEYPSAVACAQAAKDMNANTAANVAQTAPDTPANERLGGYLIECHAFNVPAVKK